MDLSALNRVAQSPPADVPAIPVDQAALNRDIIQAVKALNGTEMFGQDNELMALRDRRTQRMAVRVVNRKSGAVISEAEPEVILALAGTLKRNREGDL